MNKLGLANKEVLVLNGSVLSGKPMLKENVVNKEYANSTKSFIDIKVNRWVNLGLINKCLYGKIEPTEYLINNIQTILTDIFYNGD